MGVLNWLVNTHPKAQFTIVCSPFNWKLFSNLPRLKKLIILQKQKNKFHWLSAWKELKNEKWDIIVDFRNTIISRLLFHNKLYVKKSSSEKIHKVIQNSNVLKVDTCPPVIWIDNQAKKEAARLLLEKNPIISICPSSCAIEKTWDIQNYINLTQKLINNSITLKNAYIIVTGAENESKFIQPLIDALESKKVINFVGRDLQITAAYLSQSTIYIGNDSGIMHLSAALGIKTVGLFGPSNPVVYQPWGNNSTFITPSSCKENTKTHKVCNHINCIEVESVYKIIIKMLDKIPLH